MKQRQDFSTLCNVGIYSRNSHFTSDFNFRGYYGLLGFCWRLC